LTSIDPRLEPLTAPDGATPGAIDPRPPRKGEPSLRNGMMTNRPAAPLRDIHKRIIICADGTWNTPKQSSGGYPAPTNVWLMYQLVPPQARDQLPQLALYHTGVGTGDALNRILGGLNGAGLRENILDCYRFIIDCYRPGDELYLFGFSRGAYTVRSLAGLVRNSGIIDRQKLPDASARESQVGAAWSLYRERGDDSAPAAQKSVDFRALHSHPDFRIAGIGVWDTVGALGIPVNGPAGWVSRHLFAFHDVTLSSRVDVALHALAIDEERGPFVPTLWEQQPDAPALGQKLEQVWFTGVHSDVGGGYAWPERELANVSLRWMVNRMRYHSQLDLVARPLQTLGPSAIALHDSLTWYYRLPPVTNPISRVIDGGLGYTGARSSSRVTAESVHPVADYCISTYGSLPMPVVNRVYAPANLGDYRKRLQAETARRIGSPSTPAAGAARSTPAPR
jgi:uncharacterized protein (DUF2235 family)